MKTVTALQQLSIVENTHGWNNSSNEKSSERVDQY